jgi:hypothetical protein
MGLAMVLEWIEPTLNGMSKKDLNYQPKPDCNSMGWIVWHLTRGQDVQIADLMGGEQVWTSGKWYEKFHRPADPDDTGFGHSLEQVAAFQSPDFSALIDYYRATLEQTKKYISELD